MNDEEKTREQLIDELTTLRQQVAAMEAKAAQQAHMDAWQRSIATLVDAIPDLMFRVRKDGTYLEYNSSRAEDLIMPANTFLGKTVYEVLPELAPTAMHYLHLALETGKVQVFEHQMLVDGELRDYEARIAACGQDEVLSIIRDVTHQKRAERQLEAAVAEQERLLREIHHRVKNNLQIISSLLDLQSNLTQDQRTLELLRDNQRRISAIAFIHESMYQSNNLRQVVFARYVQDLVLYLFRSYDQNTNSIVPKINVADISLAVEQALPCGLIVNELVSNALQHAFPARRSGEIRIELHVEADTLMLIIADNGTGLPPGVDFQTSDMLGLKLVRLLTRQLRGSLSLDQTHGTAITIIFPHA